GSATARTWARRRPCCCWATPATTTTRASRGWSRRCSTGPATSTGSTPSPGATGTRATRSSASTRSTPTACSSAPTCASSSASSTTWCDGAARRRHRSRWPVTWGAGHAVSVQVHLTDDPAVALEAVGPYLASRPGRANLVLTLLSDRVARPAPGRYGWATAAGEVEGVVFQSPVTFQAALAPTTAAAAAALAGAVADASPHLPGVAGEAAPAAAFAGTFGAARRMPVHPVEAQRLHHLTTLRAPDPVPGAPRLAVPGDPAAVAGVAGGCPAAGGAG